MRDEGWNGNGRLGFVGGEHETGHEGRRVRTLILKRGPHARLTATRDAGCADKGITAAAARGEKRAEVVWRRSLT